MKPIFKDLLLAKPFNKEKHDVTGWIASEKLDGIRAYWDGETLWSKQKKIINAPLSFLQKLPKDVELDGELFIGRKLFQKLISIVRKKSPIESEWKHIYYHIFDIPFINMVYKDKLSILKSFNSDIVKPVETWIVSNSEDVLNQVSILDIEGAEGIMLRDPNSYYEFKRSNSLLKAKLFYDSEAIIIGFSNGKGRLNEMLGSLKVKSIGDEMLKLKPGIEFNVGTGFSDNERKNYKIKFQIGEIITFKYFETTNKGVPRFPVFIKSIK